MNPLERIQEWNRIAGIPNKFDWNKVSLYLTLIREEYIEVLDAYYDFYTVYNQDDPHPESLQNAYQLLLKELADLIVVTTGEIHSLGQSATEVMDAVNDSNFSKFIHLSEATPFKMKKERDAATIKYKDRHKEVNSDMVSDYYILTNENGKILKPSTYTEADMSKFKLNTNENNQ